MRLTLLRVLICALVLGAPGVALAQPELWTVEWPVDLFLSLPRGVYAVDASTGRPRARFDSTALLCLGEGGISADRRSYFVPVRVQGSLGDGVVRIDTSTKEIVAFTPVAGLAMSSSCSSWTVSGISHPRARLFASASNRWWHLNAVTNEGRVHQIIDAVTGAIVASKTFEPAVVEMRFDPGGFQRFERTSGETAESPPVLTAFADGSLAPRWSASSEYLASFDLGPAGVFVLERASGAWRLRRLEPTTGDELAAVTVPLDFIGPRIHYYGGRVLIVGAVAGAFCRGGLMWFDAETLALGNSNTPDICDASIWRYRKTLDVFVDRETGIGYWHQELIVVEFSPGVQLFDAATLTLSARRLGPGGSPAEDRRPGRVRVTEFAAPDSRAQVTWHPDAAAGVPEAFEVWAGRRGEALARVAVLDRSAGTWQSPPAPPGSYAIEVVARNRVGASVAARVEVNIADAAVPQAPTNLIAATGDRVVRLAWQAPTSGPPPLHYVIEAAPAGSANFVAVAQASLPEYFVATAPIGTWAVRVRAATAGGVSAPSNVVAVVTHACSAAPSAPTGAASLVAGHTVTIQWQPPAEQNAREYVIEVGSRPGVADLARVVVPASTMTFQTTAPDGVYAIRLRARNACGESAASNTTSVRVP